MQISLAILALVVAVQAEEGILRAPIIRNPNLGNPLEVARKKHQMLTRRSNAFDKRDPFDALLYNSHGTQYLTQVGIGSPAQSFYVTLDTGSADLWVPSSQCPASACPFGRFDDSKSSTFKALNKPFNLKYGIGSANGTYATDTVSVGDASIPNQQFGLATMTKDIVKAKTSSSNHIQANGILGLGYPFLTQAELQGEGAYNPFVFNLAAQKVIKDPVFSIFLNSISKPNWSGEIVFGGIDDTKFTGELTYLPTATENNGIVDGYFYWMVYGQGLSVKNSNTGSNPSWRFRETSTYILDTGSTLTYLPPSVALDVVTAFAGKGNFSLFQESGVYLVDCATAKSPATFQLQMSQSGSLDDTPVVLSVPASELVIPIDGTTAETAKSCMFGIAPLLNPSVTGANMYLVGDSVLRSAYMVFDMGQSRVGLAANKHIGGSVTVGDDSIAVSTSSGPQL